MKALKICLLLVLLTLVSACSTLPEQVDLSTPSNPKSFRLETALVMDDTYTTSKGKQGFFQGIYVAEKQNSLGTFYRGEKFSIFYPSAFGRYFVRTGGVWVPNDPQRKMRMYCYFNYEYKEVESYQAVMDTNAVALKNVSGINVIVTPFTPSGAAGGLIGSAIVNSIIASGTGEIQWLGEINDPAFSNKIRASIGL